MIEWLQFAGTRLPGLWLRTGEHVLLTGTSTLLAIMIGIPLGVLAHRLGWLRGFITGMVGILQTIPSLAMLAILLALLNKIGIAPAIIALVLYALLPIVRNTLAGLEGVAPTIQEAADGIGMTRTQRLWLVELPLAAPVIVTGIRTAAVVGVGIATLSAFIGAGGLGQFINRGISLSNHDLILLGAVPAALLALLVDASIAGAEWALRRRHTSDNDYVAGKFFRGLALVSPLFIFAIGILAVLKPDLVSAGREPTTVGNDAVVRIGAKNFTEQLVLGEIMAQLIEHDTSLRVQRKFDLGGTMICHGALVNGEIDLYAEYTGTALTAVLQHEVVTDPGRAYQIVAAAYADRFDLKWLPAFGFNNTYAITVRQADAKRWGVATISDLKPLVGRMRAGWTSEFSERPDGYPGLRNRYGLKFASVRDLDTALMYEAISRSEVDVICAFATDGRIAAYHLQPLIDDLCFFPPYFAAPVVRQVTIEAHPELGKALRRLADKLSSETMQRLNSLVDQDKRSPAEVAREFLAAELFAPNH